jgi:hypothetical protein
MLFMSASASAVVAAATGGPLMPPALPPAAATELAMLPLVAALGVSTGAFGTADCSNEQGRRHMSTRISTCKRYVPASHRRRYVLHIRGGMSTHCHWSPHTNFITTPS